MKVLAYLSLLFAAQAVTISQRSKASMDLKDPGEELLRWVQKETEGEGTITREELDAKVDELCEKYHCPAAAKRHVKHEVMDAFKECDANHDGQVTGPEFKKCMADHGE